VTRASARNPRWAARVTGGSHFSRCAICRAHKPLGWGWWSWSRRARTQASTRNGVATRVSRHAHPLPASPGALTADLFPVALFGLSLRRLRDTRGDRTRLPPFTRAAQWAQGCTHAGHAAQQTPRKGSCSTRALALAQAFATWVMLQHCCPSGSSTNAFKPRLRRAGGFPRRTLLHTGNSHTLNTLGARTSLGQRRNVVGACHREQSQQQTLSHPGAACSRQYSRLLSGPRSWKAYFWTLPNAPNHWAHALRTKNTFMF